MAKLTILEYPDPRLRTRAAPITCFDAALKQQVADMLETMYAAPGIGLAATQVDCHFQLLVIDVSEGKDEPQVFINPEILSTEGKAKGEEVASRCRAFTTTCRVRRAVRVRWHDASGATHERELDGLLAICLQHEMDHLYRQAVRRLPLRAEAPAHPQEARQGTPRAR